VEVNKIHHYNCLDGLKKLPDKSINCCITSPPYWGLRDYGVEDQLGLESTPQEYVNRLVEIFNEVKRVLRDDGTLWLNLGDTYNNSPAGHKTVESLQGSSTANVGNNHQSNLNASHSRSVIKDGVLKQKDLVGIPYRVAFALQEQGWYLRNDIIWHKPNAMPESVKDRCTTSHEHIFLLTKSKNYYFNQDAIREPVTESTKERYNYGWGGNQQRGYVNGEQNHFSDYVGTKKAKEDIKKGRNKRDVWTVTTQPFPEAHFAVYPLDLIRPCVKAGCPEDGVVLDPFMGAGTTALVALQEDKNFMGFELNKEFIDIAYKRIGKLDKEYYKELPEEKKPKQQQLI